MPIPWNCTKIGDVNRDGDIDSRCTVTLSRMIKTEDGVMDIVYGESEVQLSSEKVAMHEAKEAASCRYETTPVDKYYHYKGHKQFCTEDGKRCFSVTNRVLDKNGFSREIRAFEIGTHFDIAARRITAEFNAVVGDCKLLEIGELKDAPHLAKTNPTAWNVMVGIIILMNPIKF